MTQATLNLTELFASLSEEWVEGTAHLSSKSRIKSHPAYRRLLDLGPDTVPLIVARLQTEPAYWFYLLSDLTGENPVPPGSSGNAPAMVEAWTRWYEAKLIAP